MKRFGQLLSNLYSSGEYPHSLSEERGGLHVSSSILCQKQLCRILEHQGWIPSSRKGTSSAFAGWGRKKSGLNALRLGLKYNKPSFALEDGFIRSVGLGQNGEPPLSLIMDATGIYYDATTHSDLENRLNNRQCYTNLDYKRVKECLELLKSTRVSKYNNVGINLALPSTYADCVLVIDQTFNDPSIKYGLANSQSFHIMLEAAKYENPNSKIIVKTHPAVLAGISCGHYPLEDSSVEYVKEAINPWTLLQAASKVYTVSSGMGLEALLLGKQVRCFGMPFYAGWGLTHDEIKIDRRLPGVSLENLFSAVYLEYPKYYDPYLDQLTSFENTIENLVFLREQNEANKQKTYCVGMSKWKRPSVAAFLRSTYQEPKFVNSADKALQLAKLDGSRLVIWASKSTRDYENKCKENDIKLIKMEDGFLRSNGLGSDLIPPLSLVLDSEGIYYDATTSSDLETLIQNGQLCPSIITAARSLKKSILEAGLTKYNVGRNSNILNLPLKGTKLIILVPGQVADDASIKKGAKNGKVTNNLDLLKATRLENPDAFIIYKPHPDVEAGNRYGYVPQHKVLSYADYIASELSTDQALSVCDEVWTITSLMGFEALLRGKNVMCFGLPFYSGWGLTTDKLVCNRRTRRASIDEVFAATYVQYSRYIFRGLDGYMRMPPYMAPAALRCIKIEST